MKWRVYNMHPEGFTHTEKFRDETIVIKAKEFVLMDYEDAVLFRGQYFPIKLNAMNVQDPASYKVIKIEPDDASAKPQVEVRYMSHLDGKEFPSKAELEAYIKAQYGDVEPFRDESIEAQIQKESPQDTPKRRPGRPPAREKTL